MIKDIKEVFIFGFDWSRWVREDASSRSAVKPYDTVFLDYLEKRGQEIIELVENGDDKYVPLSKGGSRNVFKFSRSRDNEIALHQELAKSNHIPLLAWEFEGEREFDENKDYQRIRYEYAQEILSSL